MITTQFSSKSSTDGIEEPLRLHSEPPSQDALKKTTVSELKTYADSGAAPLVHYFSAMRFAYPTEKTSCNQQSDECISQADSRNLQNYLQAGIGLVNDHCDKWFQALERSEKRLNYEIQNDNVIKQLGTALLGIGNANQLIVATYGAVNTATSGFEDSFKGAFLFAPSANRAHLLVKSALSAKAAQLRDKFSSANPRKPTFIDVYNDLITYGDVCTDATARRLITDSVSAATASIGADGTVVVQPNVSQEVVVRALTQKLTQIKVDQAQTQLQIAQNDETTLINQRSAAIAEQTRLSQSIVDKQAEKTRLNSEIAQQKTSASSLAKDIETLQNAFQEQFGAAADNDARKISAMKDLSDKKAEQAAAQTKLDELMKRLSASDQAIDDATRDLERQRAIISQVEKDLPSKSRAVQTATEDLKAAKSAQSKETSGISTR